MALDEITLQVLHNRFLAIATEMQTAMIRSSYSGIIKEVGDASSALFSARGEAVAHSVAIPLHLGVMGGAIASCLEFFPSSSVNDGDSYVLNDPYLGGTHLPDIIVVTPLVYEGSTVAFAAVLAHHSDVGGLVPGSMPATATETFQEGLIIPPLKIREAGIENDTLLKIIDRNVRLPREVVGDLRGQIGATIAGCRRLASVFDEYGAEAVLEHMSALLDRADLMTRASIRDIPDGSHVFEDYLDHDGVNRDDRLLPVRARVTIRGDEFIVDLEGTRAQTRGSANGPPSTALAPAVFALRTIIDPTIPVNGGSERAITVRTPRGSMVNPIRPAAVALRGQLASRVLKAVYGALVQSVPDRLTADSGEHDGALGLSSFDPVTEESWTLSFEPVGGLGARPTKDGVDAVSTGLSNAWNVPAEMWEGADSPVRLLEQALRPDSGGAGQWRGGLGMRWRIEVLRGSVSASWRGDRHFTAPWGLFGGKPGMPWQVSVERAGGTTEQIHGRSLFSLSAGDILEINGGGSGGYGDPLTRETSFVLADVLDGLVTPAAARDDYGVALTLDRREVDEVETAALRARILATRGPAFWTFDRGGDSRE